MGQRGKAGRAGPLSASGILGWLGMSLSYCWAFRRSNCSCPAGSDLTFAEGLRVRRRFCPSSITGRDASRVPHRWGAAERHDERGRLALLEGVTASSATVSVSDIEALEGIVEPRWEKLRKGTLAVESNTVEVLFTGADLPAVSLRAALPHRVVVKPPLGRLFDRTGRVRHVETAYEISGPLSFSTRSSGSSLRPQARARRRIAPSTRSGGSEPNSPSISTQNFMTF